ncbi:hypothetical protein BN186_2590007 [Clostridioides difficile E23]|nr:hypothetical protein BN186_2590007 [Clostridioides difficile E23]
MKELSNVTTNEELGVKVKLSMKMEV